MEVYVDKNICVRTIEENKSYQKFVDSPLGKSIFNLK